MTTWIATTQDNKLADRTSDIESTNATTAADLQLDGNEYQAKSGVWVSLTQAAAQTNRAACRCRTSAKPNATRSSRSCSAPTR